MSDNPYNDLLLQNIKALTDSVGELRRGQEELTAHVHASTMATSTEVATVKASVGALKRQMEDVKKDARRWGAVGGIATSGTALVLGLLKAVFSPHSAG